MAEIEACKFGLLGMMDFQLVKNPVVQRTVILKFQGADRIRDSFDRIRKTMGEVIRGIDAPLVAGSVVGFLANPVEWKI